MFFFGDCSTNISHHLTWPPCKRAISPRKPQINYHRWIRVFYMAYPTSRCWLLVFRPPETRPRPVALKHPRQKGRTSLLRGFFNGCFWFPKRWYQWYYIITTIGRKNATYIPLIFLISCDFGFLDGWKHHFFPLPTRAFLPDFRWFLSHLKFMKNSKKTPDAKKIKPFEPSFLALWPCDFASLCY